MSNIAKIQGLQAVVNNINMTIVRMKSPKWKGGVMTKKQYASIVLFTIVTGFIGGKLSNHMLIGESVFADNRTSHEKVIRSESFTLVDKNGEYRGELRVQKDGNPSFVLADKNGKFRFLFLITDDKVNLNLKDVDEKTWFSLFNSNGPTMNLFDKDGHVRTSLSLDINGEPGLELKDKHDLTRAVFGGVKLESPKTGSAVKRAASSLVLFDVDGKVLWSVP
jgi:hypothetical protein